MIMREVFDHVGRDDTNNTTRDDKMVNGCDTADFTSIGPDEMATNLRVMETICPVFHERRWLKREPMEADSNSSLEWSKRGYIPESDLKTVFEKANWLNVESDYKGSRLYLALRVKFDCILVESSLLTDSRFCNWFMIEVKIHSSLYVHVSKNLTIEISICKMVKFLKRGE